MSSKIIQLTLLIMCLSTKAQAFSMDRFEDNRSRIDNVTTNEEGVFLSIDGIRIRVESIHITQNEILVLDNGNWMPLSTLMDNNYYTWRCHICKTVNVQGVSQCSNWRNHPK